MTMIHNVFACLVHEQPECVVDLVRNLHYLDPSSTILLYNGGRSPDLLGPDFPAHKYGALVHPAPRPLAWGRLHDFGLDCMQFALENLEFDTLTIVDSDQLCARQGYSEYLGRSIGQHADVGLLSSTTGALAATCQIGPVQAAFRELDLWRPFLRRFPDGERKFAHWSFWPSTVFTADAARDLTKLFRSNTELQDIMRRTRIWATEEVILPTLVALLGYRVVLNPCSHDFVKFRVVFTRGHVDAALARENVYWLHPIPRIYNDPLRAQVREAFHDYEAPDAVVRAPVADEPPERPGLVLSLPILERMRRIEGWFEEEEGDLLIAAATRALTSMSGGASIVEVGSFCGRSTVVLGSVVKALGSDCLVYAIDPHDGKVGAIDQGLQYTRPTLEVFTHNIARNGLTAMVRPVQKYSTDVLWDQPIRMLLIDGLHDYESVSRDFRHFEMWVVPGGLIAFHDYADYYPGVKKLVDEVLREGRYEQVQCVRSLIVLAKRQAFQHSSVETATDGPFVSCLMPTADRRLFVPHAIRAFLRQDYAKRELIVLDDGADSIADLIPTDDRIRYVRLPRKLTIGAKHNLGCEMARGDAIIHWDDDDWHAPRRVSYQARELSKLSSGSLCGLSRLLFYEPGSARAWEYVYPDRQRPWVSGATFCYYKDFWQQHRFPDLNEGGDTLFVWNLQDANVVAHPDSRFYIATIHSNNTSPKQTHDPAWQSRSLSDIRAVIDEDGWNFYRQIGEQFGALNSAI